MVWGDESVVRDATSAIRVLRNAASSFTRTCQRDGAKDGADANKVVFDHVADTKEVIVLAPKVGLQRLISVCIQQDV